MTPDLYNETDQSDLYGIFPIFALRHNVPSFCFFFFFFTQPPSFYLFVVFVFSSLFILILISYTRAGTTLDYTKGGLQ